jgi:Peptidase family M28
MVELISTRLKCAGLSIALIVVAICVLGPSVLAQAHQGLIASAQELSGTGAAPSEQACQTRVNGTPKRLLECIQQPSLWSHLAQFQKIADQHPGSDGHGNRDTGTAGYKASVDYVAKLMRQAGYHVTIQKYEYTVSEGTGVPRLGPLGENYAATRDWLVARPSGGSGVDYNLIAESPFGDTNHVVVVDAHLDSIFGAGMLDNASGSTTILEIALNMAKTPTHNQLRYIWFGGEEIGLFGSTYYTQHLSSAQRKKIAFDIDMDVTATPNFDMWIADPAFAYNVSQFPPNVVPQSKIGNKFFADFFKSAGIVSQSSSFGNSGTDSNSFALIGIPDSGILTRQDCCKEQSEVDIWGGFLGNYEGTVPGSDGGCVDYPDRWCDNLSNNDPFILGLASKASAYATLKLANHVFKANHP